MLSRAACRVTRVARHFSSASCSTASSGGGMSAAAANAAAAAASEDHVLHAKSGNLDCVTLNRPAKLNSLSHSMILSLKEIYERKVNANSVVWLSGAGGKAFCAGGDIAAIQAALAKRPETERDMSVGEEIFFDGYSVFSLVAKSNAEAKVTVAVWDGIVMGGGVGLGFHNPLKLVTEKTMFAMPETAIGLFPDVGMTYQLSRLGGKNSLALGRFLGVTGHRLGAVDCLRLGVATHFVLQKDLGSVKSHMETLDVSSVSADSVRSHLESATGLMVSAAKLQTAEDVERVMATVEDEKAKGKFGKCLSGEELEMINSCFGPNVTTVSQAWTKMKGFAKDGSKLATDSLRAISKYSPLSMALSFEAITRHAEGSLHAGAASLKAALEVEYRLAARCFRPQPQGDFEEGVTALLIEKRPATWTHMDVDNVAAELIEAYFAPFAPSEGCRGELAL